MPLDPKRVQAVFLEVANCHDLADRAAILDRECMGDLRVAKAHRGAPERPRLYKRFRQSAERRPQLAELWRVAQCPRLGDRAQLIEGAREAIRRRRTPCGEILCIAQRSSGHRILSMK